MDITQGKALLRQQYGDLEDWTGASAAEHGEAVADLLEPFGDVRLQLLGLFHAMHEMGRPDAPVPPEVARAAALVRCRLDKPAATGNPRPAADGRDLALVQLACDTQTLRGQRFKLLDPDVQERAREEHTRYRESVADLVGDEALRELDRRAGA